MFNECHKIIRLIRVFSTLFTLRLTLHAMTIKVWFTSKCCLSGEIIDIGKGVTKICSTTISLANMTIYSLLTTRQLLLL